LVNHQQHFRAFLNIGPWLCPAFDNHLNREMGSFNFSTNDWYAAYVVSISPLQSMQLTIWRRCYYTFFFVADTQPEKAVVFVFYKPFRSGVIFEGKGMSLP
jgi:hypothetical protein